MVHKQIATSHLDYQNIVSLITWSYYYPGLKKMVWCYIQNCCFFRCAKALREWYNGLLKPLLIPTHPWTDVILDFITDLSISNSYNTILMVVNQCTKERHYIPCITNENGTTTEVTT